MDRTDLEMIWEDQRAFNAMLRPQLPTTFEGRSELTADMTLHLISEGVELLRATAWKPHRRIHVVENRAQIRDELVDLFKYWMTLAQTWQFTPEELVAGYWAKSAVVRQRHTEEWLLDSTNATRPVAAVDLDQVLCDYISGLCEWLAARVPELTARAEHQAFEHEWIDAASLGISEIQWQALKHEFRVSGAKATLPVFPGAASFMRRLRSAGYELMILTSRPIDQYPNIYTDTVNWLQFRQIPFDRIWWSHDKAERLARRPEIFDRVRIAIDDDERFIGPIARLLPHTQCFQLAHGSVDTAITRSRITYVGNFDSILAALNVTHLT